MKRAIGCSLLLIMLCGCTPAKSRYQDFQASFRTTGPPSDQTRIDQALKAAEFRTALNLLQQGQVNDQPDPVQNISWQKTLNGLLAQAENHMRNKEFPAAGHLYHLVLETLSDHKDLEPFVDMDMPQVKGRLDECADLLLEKGLQAYRRGNLEQALEIWDRINGFHPHHKASQRAIHTTKRQLQTLEELPPST